MRGFVWVAQSAFGIARRTLSRGALAYVGEEYPPFDGDPRAAARARAAYIAEDGPSYRQAPYDAARELPDRCARDGRC
jgi:hypothetical protein